VIHTTSAVGSAGPSACPAKSATTSCRVPGLKASSCSGTAPGVWWPRPMITTTWGARVRASPTRRARTTFRAYQLSSIRSARLSLTRLQWASRIRRAIARSRAGSSGSADRSRAGSSPAAPRPLRLIRRLMAGSRSAATTGRPCFRASSKSGQYMAKSGQPSAVHASSRSTSARPRSPRTAASSAAWRVSGTISNASAGRLPSASSASRIRAWMTWWSGLSWSSPRYTTSVPRARVATSRAEAARSAPGPSTSGFCSGAPAPGAAPAQPASRRTPPTSATRGARRARRPPVTEVPSRGNPTHRARSAMR
jgi:hypothetical protein